ncbi:MAG: glycosyltransferase [Acidimicrobiales bacterium]
MTTAFVATIGGHISELVELAGRMPADEAVWITNDSPQTRDLLAGRNVEMVPFIAERDHLGVLRSLPEARRIYRRHGVDRVVSTGSAIALGYLPVAAAQRIESHYIESSTRVESCSVTGRILSKIPGVNCWWQFERAPDGFAAIEGVYDGFESYPADCQSEINKVVVTVGTTDRDFRRLIDRLIEILPPHADVLWQTGDSNVDGLEIDGRRLIPESELIAAIEQADVVISHAGAGSLSVALQAGRIPVFVPRRAPFGEQIDDHQVELARWADSKGLAVIAEADRVDIGHLEEAARLRARTKPVGKLVLT